MILSSSSSSLAFANGCVGLCATVIQYDFVSAENSPGAWVRGKKIHSFFFFSSFISEKSCSKMSAN